MCSRLSKLGAQDEAPICQQPGHSTSESLSRTFTPARHIPQIDSLRGLAALSVVAAHFNPRVFGENIPQPGGVLGKFLSLCSSVSLGNLAVAFFFALSSFLLTYLARNEFLGTGTFSIPRFLVRRCLRIWPLYFSAVAIGGLIYFGWPLTAGAFGGGAPTWFWLRTHFWIYAAFLSNWSLTFNYMWGHVDPSPPHFRILWSIATEEQFYLLFPFIILLLLSRPKLGTWIAGLVALCSILFRFWFAHLKPDLPTLSSTGGMYYASLSYGDVFLAGAFAGWLFAGHPNAARTRYRWMGLIWFVLILGCGHLWEGCLWFPYSALSVLLYTAIGVSFAGFLHWVVSCAEEPWMRWLSWQPLTALGRISYGIYMWHVVSNALLAWLITREFPHMDPGGDRISLYCFLLSIASAIAFGMASYFLIERPFLLLKSKWAIRSA
jgi:peptidoglycan/LPS O-acetylase OafA/YrhL